MKNYLLVVLLLLSGVIVAQDTNQDEMVTVPKKYVSSEGMKHTATTPEVPTVQKVSEWAGVGKEIGIATKEALMGVVDVSEKFGSTKIGTFVMVMVAWKIMAKDLIAIVFGIPIWITGLCVWIWAFKRFFIGYKVIEKQEGKTKFFKQHEPFEFQSGDAKAGVGVVMGIMITGWFVVGLLLV